MNLNIVFATDDDRRLGQLEDLTNLGTKDYFKAIGILSFQMRLLSQASYSNS